ncbi:MAG: hypothetical protein MJ240_05520 [Kiritimatiellae bacterium]|nr:hypothetical protein [Kiritimatiellia bacterium]
MVFSRNSVRALRGGLVLLFAGMCGVGHAEMFYWKGGDGDWSDSSKWGVGGLSKANPDGLLPSAEDDAYFSGGIGGRVRLDSADCVASRILVGNTSSAYSEEIEPVVFHGGGVLTATTGGISYVYSGRHVILDTNTTLKVNIFQCHQSYGVGSSLEIREGAVFDNNLGRTTIAQGSQLIVNGGTAIGNLTISSGATFRMTSGVYRYVQKVDGLNEGAILDITGGTIIFGKESRDGQTFKGDDEFMMTYWPDRAGKALVVDASSSASVVQGNNVGIGYSDDVYRLSGALYITNDVAKNSSTTHGRLFVFTNAAFYGGGELVARALSHGRDEDMPLDFALSKVWLEEGLATYGKLSKDITFHGATTFGAWGDWARDSKNRVEMHLDGDFVFDTSDCRDPSGAAHALALQRHTLDCPWTALSFLGGGLLDWAAYNPQHAVALKSLEIGDHTAVDLSGMKGALWLKDLTVGPQAQVRVPFKCVNTLSNIHLVGFANTRLAPDAQFTAIGEYASVAGNTGVFYPIFTAAPDGDWPDPAQWTLRLDGEPEDGAHTWEMRVAGPSVYLRDGKKTPYSGNVHWRGSVSGYFSDAGNWSDGNTIASGSSIWLAGEARTCITNDLTSFTSKGIRVAQDAGPYVVRGNEIRVTRGSTSFSNSSAAIYHQGQFPLVLECPIAGTTTRFWIANEASSYIALMNEQALSMPGKGITARGRILVGGNLNAAEIDLQPHWNDARGTFFAVLSHGNAVFTAQQEPLTNATPFVVSAGGRLAFEGGAFAYGVATNTHLVDGTMAILAPLSAAAADAAICFAGTGVVQVATSRSSAAGNAEVSLNGGITLEPPAEGWTTVTSEATDHAITLALPEWGRAVLAPTNDFVYGPAAGVTPTSAADSRALAVGRFGRLTLSGDANFRFADPLVCGAHATLVKTGSGSLCWDNAANVAPERLELQGGAFAWSVPLAVSDLIAATGTTLAFGATEGQVAPLAVTEGDVDLDGVSILPGDAAARQAAQRGGGAVVLTVASRRVITGTPVLDGKLRATVVDLPEGGQALRVSLAKGLTISIR